MPSKIDIQKSIGKTGIHVYSFYGELDNVNVDDTFTGIIKDIGNFQNCQIILNFIGLKYINSKGIGWLAYIAECSLSADGKMVICSPLPEVQDALEVAGVGNITAICENERAAYEKFLI